MHLASTRKISAAADAEREGFGSSALQPGFHELRMIPGRWNLRRAIFGGILLACFQLFGQVTPCFRHLQQTDLVPGV
jgi:hypothetical protein